MKQYTVCYYENGDYEPVKKKIVTAKTSADAYYKFMGETGYIMYSAWVSNYTCQNGNVHLFNNFSGKPF